MANELTADESATLAAAMLELAEQGDHDGAQRLADLAKDPERLREIMAGHDQEGS